jgi:aryl-alcohol dehydrogenase-like predicted oxidoreductase
LKRLGLTGAGLLFGGSIGPVAAAETDAPPGRVPRRKFGRHDFTVSAMALGGHALRLASDEEAARMVDAALEVGIDFLDNAWDYHQGASEELMGKLLAGRRDKFFVMTKVCTHDQAGDYALAMRMLEESLRRLRTDHLDLWQWHALATMEQVKLGFGDNGVVKALTDAKKQGKVRFVGFTGHTDPRVHLAVLKHEYPFDSCQFPISAVEASGGGFVETVLPEVRRQGIAPLAMKTLGGGFQPVKDGLITLEEGLRYSWSQPIAALVSGVTSEAQLRQNAGIAAGFHPMSAEQQAALVARVQPAAETRKFQPYRKWMSYRDGDAAGASRYV